MKHNFNINDWLPKNEAKTQKPGAVSSSPGNREAEAVERALAALEQQVMDITSNYATWRDIGFALTHFGEGGRQYFHRISRFHPEYDPQECDRQYDRCLKSSGSGITLGSLFHHLKEAGISFTPEVPAPPQGDWEGIPPPDDVLEALIPTPEPEFLWLVEDEAPEPKDKGLITPCFPDKIYEQLPEILKKAVEPATTPEERDILLLGSIGCLSACMPNVFSYYHRKRVYPNLFMFITAPASSGKGQVANCKNLVMPIHKALREEAKKLQEEYDQALAEYNATKGESREKPARPPEKMLVLPANSSNTGMFQLLFENNGQGLIFETEADTLVSAFRSEFSNYSDGFRKSFHHEPIAYFRRTEREYVSLLEPKLSAVLTGTPNQVVSLIPSAENGLYSRFLFYYFGLRPEWKDVFAGQGLKGLDEHFLELGEEYFEFHKVLQKQDPMKIVFSRDQQGRFNDFFTKMLSKYEVLQLPEYLPTVYRLGLMTYRLAMILTTLRSMEDGLPSRLRQCEDRDFEVTLEMAEVLVMHSSYIFYGLPEQHKLKTRESVKERLFNLLPEDFTTQDFLKLSQDIKLPQRSAQRFLSKFTENGLVTRESQGKYKLAKRIGDQEAKIAS